MCISLAFVVLERLPMLSFTSQIINKMADSQGRRNKKRTMGGGGGDFVERHRQNFNYVKIHTLEFRGPVAFFLRQILTDHILSIASAITLDINTSQITSIDSATAGFLITI